jgi:IS5 family transposase
VILDIHCSSNKPHDQFAEQVLKRNLDKPSVVTADKCYDAAFIHDLLREKDVRPLIQHREFGSIQKAQNAWPIEDQYNHRQISETVFRVLS